MSRVGRKWAMEWRLLSKLISFHELEGKKFSPDSPMWKRHRDTAGRLHQEQNAMLKRKLPDDLWKHLYK